MRLTRMNFLHPILFSFDLRERFQLIFIGMLARRGIAQPAINVDTGPLQDLELADQVHGAQPPGDSIGTRDTDRNVQMNLRL